MVTVRAIYWGQIISKKINVSLEAFTPVITQASNTENFDFWTAVEDVLGESHLPMSLDNIEAFLVKEEGEVKWLFMGFESEEKQGRWKEYLKKYDTYFERTNDFMFVGGEKIEGDIIWDGDKVSSVDTLSYRINHLNGEKEFTIGGRTFTVSNNYVFVSDKEQRRQSKIENAGGYGDYRRYTNKRD